VVDGKWGLGGQDGAEVCAVVEFYDVVEVWRFWQVVGCDVFFMSAPDCCWGLMV
jgi:hypothetical protein